MKSLIPQLNWVDWKKTCAENDLPIIPDVGMLASFNLVALDQVCVYAQPGDIIVIDGAGYADRALVGGMMLAYAEERKLGGFVVNGAVRDLDDIKNSPLPVFAMAGTPLGPYREGPGEINVPVVYGGQVVMPGDLLVSNSDGLVVIPRDDAAELLGAVRMNLAMEQDEMKQMKDGTFAENHHRMQANLDI